MADETQDPELELLRAHWDAPGPARDFHDRVRAAYGREFGDRPPWRRWLNIRVPLPVAAAAAIGAFLLAWFTGPQRKPAESQDLLRAIAAGDRYQPVSQPRFIAISQGEHP